MLTLQQYDDAFQTARRKSYPIVDLYERRFGFAIDRDLLESMARTLACPLKVNPPNWQHGRVIYSTLRHFLRARAESFVGGEVVLDIGTAKGFSACVMSHALRDSGVACEIVSIDAVEPDALIRRNSVAEIDGLKTVYGFIAGCVASGVGITFLGGGSSVWLERAIDMNRVVPFAFIDGKHTTQQVRYEARALSQLQRPGDMAIFDDCQLMPVAAAVGELTTYDVRYIDIGCRVYAVATRL